MARFRKDLLLDTRRFAGLVFVFNTGLGVLRDLRCGAKVLQLLFGAKRYIGGGMSEIGTSFWLAGGLETLPEAWYLLAKIQVYPPPI